MKGEIILLVSMVFFFVSAGVYLLCAAWDYYRNWRWQDKEDA